jgi:hypothetical protein
MPRNIEFGHELESWNYFMLSSRGPDMNTVYTNR